MSSRITDPNLKMKHEPMPRRVSEDDDSNLNPWVLALLLACALVVLAWTWWGGYWDNTRRAQETTPSARVDRPGERPITVVGKIQQVLSATEFTVADTQLGQIRVRTASGRMLPVGSHVRVTGRMECNDSAADGVRTDRPAIALPVMHASHVEVVGETPS